MEQKPSIGRVVHYQRYGTPGGLPHWVDYRKIVGESGYITDSVVGDITQALREAEARGMERAAKICDKGGRMRPGGCSVTSERDRRAACEKAKELATAIRSQSGEVCPACATHCGWTHSDEQGLYCPQLQTEGASPDGK